MALVLSLLIHYKSYHKRSCTCSIHCCSCTLDCTFKSVSKLEKVTDDMAPPKAGAKKGEEDQVTQAVVASNYSKVCR